MSAPTNPEDSVQAMRRMAPADLLNTSDPRQANVAPGTSTLATALVTVDRLSARVAKLEAEQSEARNRVARLEAALGFYADLDAHGARLDVYESNYTGDPADVELDRGAKARAALEDKS